MINNPVKEKKIIRNSLFMGNTVWRDNTTHKVKYIEIQYSRFKESMIYILLDVHTNLYLTNKTLFNKSTTKYFSSLQSAQIFVHDYKEIILYNDFIKKTYEFIESNNHPLFKKNKYNLYTNNLKKRNYFGINWFLIFYKSFEKNNLTCSNYYSLDDLNRFNIKTNFSSYSIITEISKGKYEIIVPENKINITPSIHFLIRKYTIKEFPVSIDSLYGKAFLIIYHFFNCIIQGIEYKPKKENIEFLTDFIHKEPEDFIKINNEILDYITIEE